MVMIDQDQCIGCGACVKDCIALNIEMDAHRAKVKDDCFLCGHCIAVCPVKAVSMDDYNMDEVIEYEPSKFDLKPEQLLNTIKFRRSIRDFKDLPVEEDKLQMILEAGRYTATGSNSQGVRFIVIEKELATFKQMVWNEWQQLAIRLCEEQAPYGEMFMSMYENHQNDQTNDRLFFNAPTILILASAYPIDAGLASANMELMAVSNGLGMLFDGFVVHAIERSEKLKEWLGVEGKQVVSCILLGHPNVQYHRTVPRRQADVIHK